jgi:hypothetical protein
MNWPRSLFRPYHDLLTAVRGTRVAQEALQRSMSGQTTVIADDLAELKELVRSVDQQIKLLAEKFPP